MAYYFENKGIRKKNLSGSGKVVIKVGTRLLTDMGVSKQRRVEELVAEVASLRAKGFQVILVSSGAVGAGMRILETEDRPKTISGLQAHAAVGQSRLMYLYENACAEHGFHCAQMLLTAADVKNRERQLNIINCLDELLALGVLPVVNENDCVSVAEIKFGDNDILAALTATMIKADLTILLTSVNGMHEKTAEGFGKRISVVDSLDDDLLSMASGTDGNRFSTGGMATKLRAASICMAAGEPLIIADGTSFSTLQAVLAGKDEGTLFVPQERSPMSSRKRYLAFCSTPSGDVVVDDGAACALVKKGRSLLPSGVIEVNGVFERGDTVCIRDCRGEEIGRGVSNFSSAEAAIIKGLHSSELEDALGYDACDQVLVHRSYLVLTCSM